MSVLKKLNEARRKFHALELKKTGENKFAGYKYFELGDFLTPALQVFYEVGLCAIVSFDKDYATMEIVDVDDASLKVEIKSPMGSAALKGCHEVQNIGAVETYQRRYLWVAALEIVEHDALDATTGKDQGVQSVRHAVRDGIGEDLPQDWKDYLQGLAEEVTQLVQAGKAAAAAQRIAGDKLDSEQRTYLENQMDSKTRSAIKKAEAEIRATFNTKKPQEAVTQ